MKVYQIILVIGAIILLIPPTIWAVTNAYNHTLDVKDWLPAIAYYESEIMVLAMALVAYITEKHNEQKART